MKLSESTEYGVYHASCQGFCSRFDFAKKILELTGRDMTRIEPISIEELSAGTERPKNTILENLMMEMTEIYKMPVWEVDLEKYLEVRCLKHE